MELRKAYIDAKEKEYSRLIAKEQQRRDSGEISDHEYEERYESIMQDRRLHVISLLDNKYVQGSNFR